MNSKLVSLLQSHGLRLGQVRYTPHPESGRLLEVCLDSACLTREQVLAGVEVPQHTAVHVVVGDGIGQVGLRVPKLVGRPIDEAELYLLGIGLRASRVVGFMEAAWDFIRAENRDAVSGGFMPRNIMWVTGPSRSADIESTLELGAHGPRRLHVVLVDDDPAALT